MPYFAVPRYLRALDELPRTENGKIRKFKLRDEGVTADTWDRDKAGWCRARAVQGLHNIHKGRQ